MPHGAHGLIGRVINLLALAGMLSVTTPVAAQRAPERPLWTCRRGQSVPTATMAVTVTLASASPARVLDDSTRLVQRDLLVAQEIAHAFDHPAPLDLDLTLGWAIDGDADTVAVPQLAGQVRLVLDSGQHVQQVGVSEPFMSADLEVSLIAAVMRADSSGAFVGIPRADGAISDTILLAVEGRHVSTAASVPVVTTLMSYIPLDQSARFPYGSVFYYPASARREGVKGSVDLRYIILPSGEPTRFEVVRAAYPEIGEVMAHAIEPMRFRPAVAGRCRVSEVQLQHIDFDFTQPQPPGRREGQLSASIWRSPSHP